MVALSSPWGRAIIDGPVDLYLAPNNAQASDQNPGTTPDLPLATLDAALEALNAFRSTNAPIRLHLASGTYVWGVTLKNLELGAPIAILGDGAGQPGDDGSTELLPPTAAGAASTAFAVELAGSGALTLQGKTIRVLTGPAAGDRRHVLDQAGDVIRPVYEFSAAVVPGDLVEITEPAVTFMPAAPVLPATVSPPFTAGVGAPSMLAAGLANGSGIMVPAPGALLFSNVRFMGTAFTPTTFSSSAVRFAGCEVSAAVGQSIFFGGDAESSFHAGADYILSGTGRFYAPIQAGLVSSITAWVGWGIYFDATAGGTAIRMTRLQGFLSLRGSGVTGQGLGQMDWYILGGQFFTATQVNFNGFLRFFQGSRVLLRGSRAELPVIVRANTDSRGCALRAIGASFVSLQNVHAIADGDGCAVGAHGAEAASEVTQSGGTVSLISGVTLSSARAGAVVMTGGRVYWRDIPTLAGAMAAGEAIICQSATNGAVVASTPFNIADGTVVVNPDGSGTILGRVN